MTLSQRIAQSSARTLMVALTLLVVSCSVAEAPVDRVYTNLVDKAVFDGEWWHASTIIDSDYDTSQLFTQNGQYPPFEGSMSNDLGVDFNRGGSSALGARVYSFPIARVRWVIDEKFLFAFRSYELVEGGNDDAGSPDFRGQPLAVYAIEDHVDVRREYNPATGEETNVIGENTSDRRWYEREFVRVDWSKNLLTDFAPNQNGYASLYGDFERTSAAFVEDPSALPDLPASYAPQFVRASEDTAYRFATEWPEETRDAVHYMSFVNREIWSPGASCGLCSSINITLRNSFLRVPPRHEYAAETLTHQEFDRFGIFRSHQSTYARGGRDRASLAVHCESNEDCGDGGFCDTNQHMCVGGLTDDLGETDFLSFYRSRHNFYADSLTDETCLADWQCDHRFDTCAIGSSGCADRTALSGSVCDVAAGRCTVPLRSRVVRPVSYTLSPHFPKHLVRAAFAVVGEWNEPLMAGQRAIRGRLPIDQANCDDGSGEICTTDIRSDVRVDCQSTDPARYCYCGSPEAPGGTCAYKYDPFESPSAARERGVPNPYDCFIEGPDDVTSPQAYNDYGSDVYGYNFVGDECMLLLTANSCDVDPTSPCQELGDLRVQFLNFIEHGGAGFDGIANPLSDPTNGELIVSNANIAAQSLEFIATQVSQFYPVLRGDVPEDQYFSGEHVRGYYARLGKVEHPVSIAPSFGEGYDPHDPTRPASSSDTDVLDDLRNRIDNLAPKLDQLRGLDGRARIYSDRLGELEDTATEAQLVDTLADNACVDWSEPTQQTQSLAADQLSPFRHDVVELAEQATRRERQLADRGVCRISSAIFNARYSRYWADLLGDMSLAEGSLRMQQNYLHGIMLHELGHGLGLRHNFAGSLDRDNYHDAYFDIARRFPLPAYLDYDAPELGGNDDGRVTGEEAAAWAEDLRTTREARLELGAGNTMSASIMDYAGDTSLYSGLGRYDHGAVIFNYFNGAEAFAAEDPTIPREPLDNDARSLDGLVNSDQYRRVVWAYYRGGEHCEQDADCPNGADSETTARQPIFQRCVTNSREGRPTACRGTDARCMCSNFHDDFLDYQSGVAYRGNNPAAFAPVDYLYCHDNRTDDLSWCTPLDAGESFQEVVEHFRGRWHDRYPQSYFRNFRRNGPVEAGSYSDILDTVKIFQHLWFRRNYELDFRANLGPLGYNDQLLASIDAMNWYAEIIGLPDVGAYELDADANVYRKVSDDPSMSGADFGLEPGQGFYLWSAYQEGLNGFFRLEHAGTFLDKFYAIEALSRRDWASSSNFALDERFFVNFFDAFETEVTEIFGGLVLRNARWYGPRVEIGADGTPNLRYLSVYRSLDRGSQDETYPQPAIDGSDTEVLRVWATIQALANFPVYYDTSFEQRMLVFKLGTADGYEIPTTRADGTPTCGYAEPGCATPDYVVYDSDRVHTSYVAVQISPALSPNRPEQQLAYQLVTHLYDRQERVRELNALSDRNDAEDAELIKLRNAIERDESYLEFLIELSRQYGLSSYLF